MRMTPFPCCCGAAILSEFGFYGPEVAWGKITKVKKAEFSEWLKPKIEINKGLAFLFIVLNKHQMAFEDTLLDCGFIEVGEGYNNSHSSTLKAYILAQGAE